MRHLLLFLGGSRWLEVGTETIRKPQVAGSLPVAGSIPVQGFQELHERSGLWIPWSTLFCSVERSIVETWAYPAS
jgi:hypothetical protein